MPQLGYPLINATTYDLEVRTCFQARKKNPPTAIRTYVYNFLLVGIKIGNHIPSKKNRDFQI